MPELDAVISFPSRLRSHVRGPMVLVAVSVATACSWSVPADPAENARLRSHASDAGPVLDSRSVAGPVLARGGGATDDGARVIYLQRCGRCHEPFSPRHASPDEWPGLVRKYGPRAGLFGEDRDRVLRWLEANAR